MRISSDLNRSADHVSAVAQILLSCLLLSFQPVALKPNLLQTAARTVGREAPIFDEVKQLLFASGQFVELDYEASICCSQRLLIVGQYLGDFCVDELLEAGVDLQLSIVTDNGLLDLPDGKVLQLTYARRSATDPATYCRRRSGVAAFGRSQCEPRDSA